MVLLLEITATNLSFAARAEEKGAGKSAAGLCLSDRHGESGPLVEPRARSMAGAA